MKNIKKWILGLIPVVIFLFALTPTGVFNDDNSIIIYYDNDYLSLKSSGYYYVTSAISIDDTIPANNWSTTAATYDWCSGFGNSTHPYVIEDIVMDLSGSGTCITIQNSNAYFIIENCSFSNAQYGIKFNSVSNGKINDITITYIFGSGGAAETAGQESRGVYIEDCQNINITHNLISDISGGNGGAGNIGTAGSPNGGPGGHGGAGALAYGLYLKNVNNINISNNAFNEIRGGNGGDGGRGGHGSSSGTLGDGGAGGTGGAGGLSMGIYFETCINIINHLNNISNCYGGNGGIGGNGGNSYSGLFQQGNYGGAGGQGGAGGLSKGLNHDNCSSISIKLIEIQIILGGDGGDGGTGGKGGSQNSRTHNIGGSGGSGGLSVGISSQITEDISYNRTIMMNVTAGNGGNGGDGGYGELYSTYGGNAGNAGEGAFTYGFLFNNSRELMLNNINISLITSGRGGTGGTGGNNHLNSAGIGGSGGNGGDGGLNKGFAFYNCSGVKLNIIVISNCSAGNGGNGNKGGNGGSSTGTTTTYNIGGKGGNGGLSMGIDLIKSENIICNSSILMSLNAGDGGSGGDGGAGKPSSRNGGDAGNGGTGNLVYGIFIDETTNISMNDNSISDIIGGNGANGGTGGNYNLNSAGVGGIGGNGGNGGLSKGLILNNCSSINLNLTEILDVSAGNGGSGGKGGDGGSSTGTTTTYNIGGTGGNGELSMGIALINSENIICTSSIINNSNAGDGGNGGNGGAGQPFSRNGGDAGNGGFGYLTFGIFLNGSRNIRLINNFISNIIGGDGGPGGTGGNHNTDSVGVGGSGGVSGNGEVGIGLYYYNCSEISIDAIQIQNIVGGAGGTGGIGGIGGSITANIYNVGGNGGNGGLSVGISFILSENISYDGVILANISAGFGGDGGLGGAGAPNSRWGGNGGNGGNGALAQGIFFKNINYIDDFLNFQINNVVGSAGGRGGDGGDCGGTAARRGGDGGEGGMGGNGIGISLETYSNIVFSGNEILYVSSGNGGDGGDGGIGSTNGDGGIGGNSGFCTSLNITNAINFTITNNIIRNCTRGSGGNGGGSAADGTTALSSGTGFYVINLIDSQIINNEASDCFWGFQLSLSNNNNFSLNTIYDNDDFGLVISNSPDTIIHENNVSYNGNGGIWIANINDLNITENVINNNIGVGLTLNNINDSLVMGNIFNGNTGNYHTESDSYNNDIRFNVVDGYLAPIIISDLGNGNFTWEEAADLLLWCYGSGTLSDPYIFEDVNFNGQNSESGIIVEDSNVYFIIKNCMVKNAGDNAGIKLDNVSNGELSQNNCSFNNFYGIYVSNDCADCTVDGNIIDDCNFGIYVKNSTGCVISNNNITNCASMRAIFLDASVNCNLQSNTMFNCSVDLNVVTLTQGTSHVMGTSNLINGKSLYYYANTAGVFTNAGQVILVNCGSATISNVSVSNCAMGVILISCNNIIINNITANENLIGIDIRNGNNNRVTESTICFNYNYGIKINTSNSNTITSACNISYNKMSGIWIYTSDYTTISNSDINYNEQYGIHLILSDHSTISGNSITYNTNNGIYLDASEGNNIYSSNTIAFNQHGIYLDGTSGSCNNNEISNNILYNNTDCGIYIDSCHYSILSGNTISNSTNNGIYLNACNYTTISSETIISSTNGIYLDASCNVTTISGCTISNSTSYGISFNGGTSNTISSNNFNYNILGIYLDGNSYSCDNNNILGNTMVSNTVPIRFEFGHNNSISGNTISYTLVGIQLYDSNYNYFSNNVVQNNAWFGLQLTSSDSNIFTGNTFSNTTVNECVILYGTGTDCDNNKFYNNFFRWNLVAHARDDGTSNIWTYGSIGNYWDNYTGVDADFNGIGDIPYIYIKGSAGAQDVLPIWDSNIIVSIPLNNSRVGITAPDFEIVFNDPNVNTTWYTIDSGLTNFTFTINGQINETHWQELWNDISNGETITFRIYFNNTYGYLVFKDITLVKYVPPDYTPLIMMVTLIALISAAAISVASVLYIRHKKKKAKAALPAFSDKLISKKGKKFAESLSLSGELSQTEFITPIPSASDGEYVLSKELSEINKDMHIIPAPIKKDDIPSAAEEQKSIPTDQALGVKETKEVQERDIDDKDLDKKLKIKLAHEIISESKDPLDWYAHGMKLAENGNLNEAVECFNEVLKEQPLNSDAWYFLGESNEKLGKFNEAIKCYDEAIRVKDIAENAQSEDNQIETTTSVEKVVEDSKPIQEKEDLKPLSSSEIIEKMISTTQKDVEFVKNGRRFERAGNLEEAIKCYDKALQENPENVEAWFNKGKIFEKLGYSELAQEAIDKVYELTKDD